MHAMTLRNIPADLFAFLRQDAAAHHRSLNRQAIAALDAYRTSQVGISPSTRSITDKRAQLTQRLSAIRTQLAASANRQTIDEILGFDDHGLPT
jgi:plasmid stability protein